MPPYDLVPVTLGNPCFDGFANTGNRAATINACPTGMAGYRGRFAPSPTGPLHLGSLFTAVASYLRAKSLGGVWLLRIDDLDTARVAAGATDRIMTTLDRLGLHWAEPVVFQSGKGDAYRAALAKLDAEGLLYPCACSRKTLSLATEESNRSAVYPGICRALNHPRDTPHTLRLAAGEGFVATLDRLQGMQRWGLGDHVGDVALKRRDGIISYHLATVVDDADMAITEVARGVDLLEPSTPTQIYLQQLLGLPTPDYLHVPVVTDSQGDKLSKQNLAKAVDDSRPAESLTTALALLRHPPPAELRHAPPGEILAWAASAWDLAKLAGVKAIAENGGWP